MRAKPWSLIRIGGWEGDGQRCTSPPWLQGLRGEGFPATHMHIFVPAWSFLGDLGEEHPSQACRVGRDGPCGRANGCRSYQARERVCAGQREGLWLTRADR